jgi:hypothetical protein
MLLALGATDALGVGAAELSVEGALAAPELSVEGALVVAELLGVVSTRSPDAHAGNAPSNETGNRSREINGDR